MHSLRKDEMWLKLADFYAQLNSGCCKVQVGAAIVKKDKLISLGANKSIPNICTTQVGCLRKAKYGEDSKNHRNPEDCRAIHSEIDAICNATRCVSGAIIYVTRYPCEACARAIIAAKIKRVIYARDQKISELTRTMLEDNDIDIVHYAEFFSKIDKSNY